MNQTPEQDAERKTEYDLSLRARLNRFKEVAHVYGWVWREFITPEARRWVRPMVGWMLVAFGITIGIPYAVSYIIDYCVAKNWQAVDRLFIALIIAVLISRASDRLSMNAREWILGINMGARDKRINELIMEKSLGQHLRHADILSHANIEKGRARIGEIKDMMLFEGNAAIMTFSIAFVLLWVISPIAGLIMFIATLFHFGWTFYLNEHVMRVCVPLDERFRKLNRHMLQRWEYVVSVKVNNRSNEEITHMYEWFQRIIGTDRGFWIWYITHATVRGTITTLATIAILYYGTILVRQDVWAVGMLYPVYIWSCNVRDNLWRLSQIEHRMNWNLPAVKSLMEALTLEPDIVDAPDAIEVPEGPLEIELRDVSYAYEDEDGQKHYVLRNVSFTLGQGRHVALIGDSGAGKTTLMRLLLRYMDPTEGAIIVNGVDLRKIKIESWWRRIGYIPQEAMVFDGTLRDNLLYGLAQEAREAMTDEALWAMVRRLKIDFEGRLTRGLDTLVGKKGVKLSGGQKQRIMIGRAVLRNAAFMLIDEATSSLDVATEAVIRDEFRKILSAELGSITITHRLAAVRGVCDTLVFLRKAACLTEGQNQVGGIAGSFEELAQHCEPFKEHAAKSGIDLGEAAA